MFFGSGGLRRGFLLRGRSGGKQGRGFGIWRGGGRLGGMLGGGGSGLGGLILLVALLVGWFGRLLVAVDRELLLRFECVARRKNRHRVD